MCVINKSYSILFYSILFYSILFYSIWKVTSNSILTYVCESLFLGILQQNRLQGNLIKTIMGIDKSYGTTSLLKQPLN